MPYSIGLTHYGPVTPYGDIDLVNIDPGNDLVPDGTKHTWIKVD